MAAFALVVGCGGGSHSTDTLRPLAFVPDAEFNGKTTYAEGPPNAVVEGSTLTVNASSEAGGLSVSVLGSPRLGRGKFSISRGQANAKYFTASGQNAWRAQSGTVEILRIDDAEVTVRLDNVAFLPDTSFPLNFFGIDLPAGTFSLSGDLANAPIASSSSPPTALVFTGVSSFNGSSSPFPANTLVGYSYIPGDEGHAFAVPPSQRNRLLALNTFFDLVDGQVIDLSTRPGTFGFFYMETTTRQGFDYTWVADSGTATVIRKTADTLSIRLDNAHFSAEGSFNNLATGSFRLDGVYSKR